MYQKQHCLHIMSSLPSLLIVLKAVTSHLTTFRQQYQQVDYLKNYINLLEKIKTEAHLKVYAFIYIFKIMHTRLTIYICIIFNILLISNHIKNLISS